MSASPEPSEASSGGFKSFWKKSDSSSKPATQGNVTFVQQDPSASKKGGSSKLSKFLKRGSVSTASGGDEGGDSKNAAQKRRQQVYNAQKRHRGRKAQYVTELEAEIAKLQQMDAAANAEKNALAHQNNAMKEFLAAHSLEYNVGSMSLAPEVEESLSSLGSASIDIRQDPDIGGRERTFLDFQGDDEMAWTSDASVTVPVERQGSPVKGDSWAAVDFILALEFPCQDHMPHHGINPEAKAMTMESEFGEFTGHSLTMTSSVYEGAMPPAGQSSAHNHLHAHAHAHAAAASGGSQDKWQLPHSEIDKLVKISEHLPMDEEEITPAQAYSAIREAVPSDELLKPTLDALKVPLAGIVECRGFGTVMPTDMFRQYLHTTVETLKLQSP